MKPTKGKLHLGSAAESNGGEVCCLVAPESLCSHENLLVRIRGSSFSKKSKMVYIRGVHFWSVYKNRQLLNDSDQILRAAGL